MSFRNHLALCEATVAMPCREKLLRWYQGKSKFFLKKSLFLSTILVYKFVIEKHSQKIEFVKKYDDVTIMRIINDILAKNMPYFLTKISQ